MLIAMGSTGSRTLHSKAESSFSSVHDEQGTPLERTLLVEALSELRNLLEEYAPSWYTEQHHRKTESALHPKKH
jgi:hypothetical protein